MRQRGHGDKLCLWDLLSQNLTQNNRESWGFGNGSHGIELGSLRLQFRLPSRGRRRETEVQWAGCCGPGESGWSLYLCCFLDRCQFFGDMNVFSLSFLWKCLYPLMIHLIISHWWLFHLQSKRVSLARWRFYCAVYFYFLNISLLGFYQKKKMYMKEVPRFRNSSRKWMKNKYNISYYKSQYQYSVPSWIITDMWWILFTCVILRVFWQSVLKLIKGIIPINLKILHEGDINLYIIAISWSQLEIWK